VEGVRTDVRIVNTSLLGTDWYIDQMKYRQYDSPPVPFKLSRENYLIGTNDWIEIVERISEPQQVKDVVNFLADPRAKATLNNGKKVSYLPTRNFILPVNKENVLRNGSMKASDSLRIPDQIIFSIPKKTNEQDKNSIIKPELMVLDLLANNDWERPVYFVSMGGDVDLGFRDYLQYNGFAYKLTPFRNASRDPQATLDKDVMYDRLMNVYRWGNMNDPKIWLDWNNYWTMAIILNVRNMHGRVAGALNRAGDHERALDLLNRAIELMPDEIFPYSAAMQQNDVAMLSIIEEYYLAGAPEKAGQIAERFITEADENLAFYANAQAGGEEEMQVTLFCLQRIAQLCKRYEHEELANKADEKFQFFLQYMQM